MNTSIPVVFMGISYMVILILQTLHDKHDEITIWNFICCFDKKQRLYWLTKSKSCKIMSSLAQEVPHLDNNTKTNHMQSTLKNLKHAFKVNKLLHPNLNLKGEEKEKGIMSLKLADSDGNKRSLKPLLWKWHLLNLIFRNFIIPFQINHQKKTVLR